MTQRASYYFHNTWMGKEFGESYARKLFGDAIVDACPRNSKGKNEGQFKTILEWIKVSKGGWTREGGHGHVENRVGSTVAARIIIRPFRGKPVTVAEQGDVHLFAMVD